MLLLSEWYGYLMCLRMINEFMIIIMSGFINVVYSIYIVEEIIYVLVGEKFKEYILIFVKNNEVLVIFKFGY